MPRYLTPAKLCLLVLIDLYIHDHIPSSSKLNILSFIASQINIPSDHSDDSIEERIKDLSSNLNTFSETLSQWSSGIPGRTIYDILLQSLWDYNELDSLHVLFQHLGQLLTAPDDQEGSVPKLSRASPLGQFVRRCCVEFTRLQFSDSQALWNAFASYRAPSHSLWSSRNPAAARKQSEDQPPWATPQTSNPAEDGSTSPTYTSTDDSEVLLTFSISRLQKLGTRVPSPIKAKLQQWMTDQSDSGAQSLQHFMAFFESWRSGQYTMALESLHRYFDYSLGAKGDNGNVKVYYQYALLHLSVLHADFEFWGESVEAMEECIGTARENQDTACLNFALSWLLYLRQAHPKTDGASFDNLARLVGGGSSEQDEIASLKAKAREGRHWSLMSSTLLEEAKLEMYSGGSLSGALEHILQATYLDVQHDLRTLMPAAAMFQGASFDRLGQAALSSRIYESVKLTHGAHAPLNDRVRASCRVAYNLTQDGQYQDAMQVLEGMGTAVQGVLKLEQRVQAFEYVVQLKINLHKNDLTASEYHLQNLQPARAFGDPEIVFEIALLGIELLMKQRDYQAALHNVNTLIAESKQNTGADIAQHLHLLTLKARIFAAGGQAPKGFSIALRAASMAERYLLISVLTEALAVLSAIMIELGEFEAGRDLAEAALPHALEGRDLQVTAELFSHLAEGCVGVAGKWRGDEEEQMRWMRSAEMNVERSYAAYERLENIPGMLECTLMKGRLARWRKEDVAARAAEEMYAQLTGDLR